MKTSARLLLGGLALLAFSPLKAADPAYQKALDENLKVYPPGDYGPDRGVAPFLSTAGTFPQGSIGNYPTTFLPPPPKPWNLDPALEAFDKEQERTAFISKIRPYTLANLMDAAGKKGLVLFDIEQGRYSPTFASCDLGTGDGRAALEQILASEGWGYEMRGEVAVIFNRKLRALGDAYPLNRRISSLVLTDVSLDEAFHIIGRMLHVEIMAGGSPVIYGTERPMPRFSVSLHDVTLREALFVIAPKLNRKMWSASLLWVPPEPILGLSFFQ